MLQTPTEFPHVGSYAVFRGAKVRIQRVNPNGTRLVIGQTDRRKQVTATVTLDQLTAWSTPEDAVDLWASARIVSVSDDAFTTADDTWADFFAWHSAVYQREPGIDKAALARRLTDRGFRAKHGRKLYTSGIRKGFGFLLIAAPAEAAA
ncbi:hypothetical protein NUH86_01590 [Sphingobium sp. JS3065]|uniref:hypothetical protein n=1 Tax=Sphingobium sp. JS3065 TaxID=2970925 RepID=UPI0022643A7E|nr:hypothetical protein [Sphingobium sp. JS3065]UZW55523.1 hypothetical protein NUH86_01590 [Sphingobium sp. JS3065]